MKRKYFIVSLVVMCMLLLFVTIFFTFFKTATFGEEKEVKVWKGKEVLERSEFARHFAEPHDPFNSYGSQKEMLEATMQHKDSLEEAKKVLSFEPVLPKETLGKKLVGVYVNKEGEGNNFVAILYSNNLLVEEYYAPWETAEGLVQSELSASNQGKYPYAVPVEVNGVKAVAWNPTCIEDSEGYGTIVPYGCVKWLKNGVMYTVSHPKLGYKELMKVAESIESQAGR